MPEFKVKDRELIIDKEVTKLDKFVIGTLEIIEKYVDYVIISGYVSIFFGRARATEDVDIFIDDLSSDNFKKMYDELVEAGYEFNIDDPNSLYFDYLKTNLAINVWRKNFPLLRIEMKIASKPSQQLVLKEKIKVKFKELILYFSSIEAQIAYKRYIAKSEKDLEDARHLEVVFTDLNKAEIERFKGLFEHDFKYG